MTDAKGNLGAGDDCTLDLLVDGELSDHQRRRLLAALDDQPDGWRRCALAFVEAQTWGRDLKTMCGEAAGAVDEAASANSAVKTSSTTARTLLAMAAGFLVAFALGIGWSQWTSSGGATFVDHHGGVATDDDPSPGGRIDSAVAETNDSTGGPGLDGADPDRDSPENLVDNRQVEDVRRHISLPLVNVAQAREQPWFRQPAAIPDHVLQSLRRSGHEVTQQRQWLPVDLEDGSRVVIPVDQVDLRYVGAPSFQ